MPNPLQALHEAGQAVWLDSIRRSYLGHGNYLDQLIGAGEVWGLTSNPTIFAKAVATGDAYQLGDHAGADPRETLWTLMKDDVRTACDQFLPVHRTTGGAHGQVSIEVEPALAYDTAGTIEQARSLWREIDRPNLMVKVPGTEPGLEAISQLVGEGVNVNVTLLFAVERYEQVIAAYFDGLRRRADAGHTPRVTSVASFFVSRVDGKVDPHVPADVSGLVAIANARVAYASFLEAFSDPDWEELAELGAVVQRPLWASTSTKNPAYPDTLYVEGLVAPHTVNTMPEQTLDAVRDHGTVTGDVVTPNIPQARDLLSQLEDYGVDLGQVTKELEAEGVDAFAASFDEAVATVAAALDART